MDEIKKLLNVQGECSVIDVVCGGLTGRLVAWPSLPDNQIQYRNSMKRLEIGKENYKIIIGNPCIILDISIGR